MSKGREMPLLDDTLTMILAGGQGSRLYPLTRDRAKPAVPFGGLYRIIDFTLSNCLNSGLCKIDLITQYKSFSLDRHISLGWSRLFNRPEQNEYLNIIPPQQRVTEDWYLGTADAIFQNIYFLERERPKHVLILGGDHIYKMDYSRMIKYHIDKGAESTVACTTVPVENAYHFGIVQTKENGSIYGFQEKPKENPTTIAGAPTRCLASMGIYVFDTEVLVHLVSRDARDSDSAHDFGKNIIPDMVNDKHPVFAYPFVDETGEPEYWRDVGTLDAYWEANTDLIDVDPDFNLDNPDWPIHYYVAPHPPAKFVHEVETDKGLRRGEAIDSIVALGVVISGGRARRCVLSPEVRINSFAVVEDSILMDGVDVGRHCKIRKAIIDKRTTIPPNTVIGYDHNKDRKRFAISKNGVVIVPKEMPFD
jgi:glucose-1-phosphate adenylyltransferase